jgi:RNA polymerase sigma-70 factor (ECF subfamily)
VPPPGPPPRRAGRPAPDDDDRTLIVAAQAGDRDALDRLLRRHHDRFFAVCRRLTGNEADARDATQEALVAVVRGLPRYDGRAAFTTWAYRVVTNACLDELRRRRRRPDPGLPDHEAERPGDAPDVATTVVDHLALDEALATLGEDFRAPVVLRDVVGLDYAEIAEVLAIPAGTVRSRIARGRRALAAELGGGPRQPARAAPRGNQPAVADVKPETP